MGIVFVDHYLELADGEQFATDGHEVQRLYTEKQFTQGCFTYNWFDRYPAFKMAFNSGYFHCLHYFIFALQKQNNNMIFTAQVKVMPLKELLDPQGKAVLGGFQNLGLSTIQDVRIGKNISLQIEADTVESAEQIAQEAARKLLANPVMEMFEITIH